MKPKVPVKVRVWTSELKPSSQPRSSWSTALAAAILVGAVGLVISGSWLAVRIIVNPRDLSWLSHLVPLWNEPTETPPQTLAEIKAEVARSGAWIESSIYFSSYPGITSQQRGFEDVLFPVFESPKHCRNDRVQSGPAQPGRSCAEIRELRVYRATAHSSAQPAAYTLIDRVAIVGPEELTVLAPLTQTSSLTQGSNRTLPLTQVSLIDGKAPPGVWFQLSGEWKRGSRILYGQVMQYDPQRGQLTLMQSWSSPAAQLPYWQQVTGSATSELIVNQSIGLEPQFQVYQLKQGRSTGQTTTLEPISLTETALADRNYSNALLLARHGLWSPALQLLQTVKQKGKWAIAAQSQLDVIALHAKITQSQADRDWASPTQQLLAQVMDGRWSKALGLLKSAHVSGYDVRNLLATNADRLWQRIETNLRVNPRQPDLQQWGALILTVQQSRQQAMTWWQKQPARGALQSIQQTLSLLEPTPAPKAAAIPVVSDPVPEVATYPTTGLIGAVTAVTTPTPAAWSTPASRSFELSPQQRWYQIEVLGFDDGQLWRHPPFTAIVTTAQANQLWNLLGSSQPQLVAWQGTALAQTLSVTVKALRSSNGRLFLLASGEPMPQSETLLAITPSTIAWLQPTTSLTLNDLAQQAVWKTTLIPQLWQNLQTAQLVTTDPTSDPLQSIGSWVTQQIELTGDQQPETILTIEAATGATPHTLIFSSQGTVLYNDLAQQQVLVAIAKRSADQRPILIIRSATETVLQQWSEQNQRFE